MSTDNQTPNQTETFLTDNVVLLAPTLSIWKGQYQLPTSKTKTTVDDVVVEEGDVTTPRAKLFSKKYPLDKNGVPWQKRFQDVDSALTKLKNSMSVAFPINGVRILPKASVAGFLERVYGDTVGRIKQRLDNGFYTDARERDAKARDYEQLYAILPEDTPVFNPLLEEQSLAYTLRAAAIEFCDDLDGIYAQMAQSTVWEQVKHKVPKKASEMLAKFQIDVLPIEVAASPTTSGIGEFRNHLDVVREACRRRAEEAIDAMISEPREQLDKALQELQDLIARQGQVTERSFDATRRAMEKIRLFECVADSTMLSKMAELDRALKTSPRTIRDSKSVASNFSAVVANVQAEIVSETARVAAMNQLNPLRAGRAIRKS